MKNSKTAISIFTLLFMSPKELKKVKTITRKYEKPRCQCKNIQSIKVEKNVETGEFIIHWETR